MNYYNLSYFKFTKLLLVIALALYAEVTFAQQPTIASNPNDVWEIRWSASDEFNGNSPDWSKWIRSGNLPNTTAWKWDNTNNVEIQDGVAALTMRQNPNNANDGNTYFKSGILKSYQTFTYGYYEAKIKGADIGEGVCPSFWLFSNFDYSVGNGQTVYSEIDVVELQQFDWYEGHQDDIYDMDHNLHAVVMENGTGVWRRPKQHPNEQLNKYRAPWDPTEDYHIYGCEVNENEIIWYVDGIEVARKPNTYWYRPMNVTLSLGLRKPFVEFYNNRNNAVNPETDPDAAAQLPGMPTTMYVDYVRVWEKSDTPAPPSLDVGEIGNPDFESGDLSFWTASIGESEAVNNNASEGNYAAKVTNGNVAQNITLKANTQYTISVDAKVESNGTTAFLGIHDAVLDEFIVNYPFSSTNYENGSITFTTANQEQRYRLWFYSSGTAYCDRFTIQEGEGTPPVNIDVEGVSLSLNDQTISIGETVTINASIIPSNATNKNVEWLSSNTSVVTVNNGIVSALASGTATITATTEEGSFTDSIVITVEDNSNLIENAGFEIVNLSDWNFEGSSSVVNNNVRSGNHAGFVDGNGSINQLITLQPNTTYHLSAWGKVGSAGQSVYVGVTNNSTSTFIENALFTSTDYESKTIVFMTGNSTDEYRVWFWNNQGGQYYIDDLKLEEQSTPLVAVESISISSSEATLLVGESFTLSSTVLPVNASNKAVTWSSLNNNIATVSAGVVNALGEGTTKVRATTVDGGFVAECDIIVNAENTGGGNVGLPSIGSTIWLSTLDGNHVTVNTGSATALQATKSNVTNLEQFLIQDADGFYALQSVSTGKYVTATSTTNTSLRCGATGVFERQKFTVELNNDGNLVLKAKINNNYVSVAGSLNSLEAKESTISSATPFTWGTNSSSRFNTQSLSQQNQVKVYPNPYHDGNLVIQLQEITNGTLKAMDIHGKEIINHQFTNKKQLIIPNSKLLDIKGLIIFQIVTSTNIITTRIICD